MKEDRYLTPFIKFNLSQIKDLYKKLKDYREAGKKSSHDTGVGNDLFFS